MKEGELVLDSKEKSFYGPLTELLTFICGLGIGFLGEDPTSLIPLAVALVFIGWRCYKHKGKQRIYSAVRKCLTLIPGALLYFGVIDPTQVDHLVALGPALLSIVWSSKVNKKEQCTE